MKKLAIVICNFNKQDYIIDCIRSVLRSSYSDFDIYVVDNASTDKSIEFIKSIFPEEVNLIINNVNKGGSGGFNTGIREALKKDYEYIMLLDNDVIIDEHAVEESIKYLEGRSDVAVVGSKIYSMDKPDEIQELGANIDFEKYYISPLYKGCIDTESIPELVMCQYVPACSMMIRVSAIREIGLMPEENFIYWDDIDWGYRFILKGYKVMALSKSKVWHKMGVKTKDNTFGTYYFWRNRVKFFMTYCNIEQKQEFSQIIFKELFQSIYICNYIGKYSSGTTILNAVLDGINGVVGKAPDGRIMNVENIGDRLGDVIKNKKRIIIVEPDNINHIRDLINRVRRLNHSISIILVTSDIKIKKQFLNENIRILDRFNNIDLDDLQIRTCNHILDIRNSINKEYIYIDKYFNMIATEEDIQYIRNYDKEMKLFKNILYPIISNGVLNNMYSEGKNV